MGSCSAGLTRREHPGNSPERTERAGADALLLSPQSQCRAGPQSCSCAANSWHRRLDTWFGITLPFTVTGAVIAEAFVAIPLLVISAEGTLRTADPRYEEAATTLDAPHFTMFRRGTLPFIATRHCSGRGPARRPMATGPCRSRANSASAREPWSGRRSRRPRPMSTAPEERAGCRPTRICAVRFLAEGGGSSAAVTSDAATDLGPAARCSAPPAAYACGRSGEEASWGGCRRRSGAGNWSRPRSG